MNIATKCNRLTPIALAVALIVPAAAALAESAEVVTTRGDTILQEYGRASGNDYWQHRQLISPPERIVDAYDKTKAVAVDAIDNTKAILTQTPSVPPNELQRYGRAGGFVGLENFQVPQSGITALSSSPSNAAAIKSGETQSGYSADTQLKPLDGTSGARDTNQTGNITSERYDESAYGQNQTGADYGRQ